MHMGSASGPSLAARTSAREVHACKVHAHKVTSPPEADFSRIWLISIEFTIEIKLLERQILKKIASGGKLIAVNYRPTANLLSSRGPYTNWNMQLVNS